MRPFYVLFQGTSRVDSYLTDDRTTGDEVRVISQAWKGAEAYHFYLLALRQLYDGYVDAAMSTGQCFVLVLLLLRQYFSAFFTLHSPLYVKNSSIFEFHVLPRVASFSLENGSRAPRNVSK